MSIWNEFNQYCGATKRDSLLLYTLLLHILSLEKCWPIEIGTKQNHFYQIVFIEFQDLPDHEPQLRARVLERVQLRPKTSRQERSIQPGSCLKDNCEKVYCSRLALARYCQISVYGGVLILRDHTAARAWKLSIWLCKYFFEYILHPILRNGQSFTYCVQNDFRIKWIQKIIHILGKLRVQLKMFENNEKSLAFFVILDWRQL